MNSYGTNSVTTTVTLLTTVGSGDNDIFTDDDAPTEGEKLAVSIQLMALSVLGTFGNGLVLCISLRKKDKTTSKLFILSMAWCDFFASLIVMPFVVANIHLDDNLNYEVLCKLYYFLITCNVPLSAYIMVAVAVDRYFHICHPFLHVVTPHRARISILCLFLLAFSIGAIIASMHSVYGIILVPDRNCSEDHNTTQDGGNFSFSKVNGKARYGILNITLQGSENLISLNYSFDIQYGREGHCQQQYNNSAIQNVTSSHKPICRLLETEQTYVYNENGFCTTNEKIFSFEFQNVFHIVYMFTYIICLLSVFTLYFLIYRVVIKSRARRRKLKLGTLFLSTVSSKNTHMNTAKPTITPYHHNADGENMDLNPRFNDVNVGIGDGHGGDGGVSDKLTGMTDYRISGCELTGTSLSAAGVSSNHKEPCDESGTKGAEKKTRQERQDSDFLANIRTAVMLFVVTIVFIISFLPAWLMATFLIDYNIFVFHMYFIHNVANPVIYGFMNKSFRKDLKLVFQTCAQIFKRGCFTG